MEELTIDVIIGQISGRQHFKSDVGIGSTLQVFGGHLRIICWICVQVVDTKLSSHPSGRIGS